MTDDLPERRNGHPYVMYDMLKSSKAGILKTIDIMEKTDFDFLKPPYCFTGNGTAFHAAALGSLIIPGNSHDFIVMQSYELENYSDFTGTVIGFSHTGKTKSTVDSVKKAGKTCTTIGISHYNNSPLIEESSMGIVIGDSPDMSLCNTKAFFDNYFAALEISKRISDVNINSRTLADQLHSVINGKENEAKEAAKFMGNRLRNIFVLGAGPSYYAARETAQKLKESTHIHAEGIELEEFNHGCTSVIDERSAVIMINSGRDERRASEIARACREVGTRTLSINAEGDFRVNIPEPERMDLFPVLAVGFLYTLCYYMALVNDVNPDLLRFEDKKYLDFDSIVFPPGAH